MAKAKRKDLGKGLKALLSGMDEVSEGKEELVKEISKGIAEIPLNQIEVNPYQPRNEFDEEALNELAESIKNLGVIQPITLRRLSKDQYQLISGERRFRASKLAGLENIPAYVRVVDDTELLEMAIVENIQRQDLNAVEISLSYQRLLEEFGYTHDQLAQRLSKSRATVTNYLRLLKLPPQIQLGLKKGEITMGHARALLGVDDIMEQLHIFKRIVGEKMSVREAEKIVQRTQRNHDSESKEKKASAPYNKYQAYEDRLKRIIGSQVKLKVSEKGKGSLVVNFADHKELRRLLQLFDTL